MPFTLAHPAVLFPLAKRSKYFSATALFIGSMVPDVEFIAQMHQGTTHSHHFPGIFLINVPLGLLLCWLFHNLIKQSLVDNLPSWLQVRFLFLQTQDWNTYFKANKMVVLTSLCIGIASHFAWDTFTHQNLGMLEFIPSLGNEIYFFWDSMPVYHALQIICSLFGLIALVYAVWKLPAASHTTNKASLTYWLSFGLFFSTVLLIRFYLLPLDNGFWDVVLAIMGAGMYAMILNAVSHSLLLYKLMKPVP